MTVQEMIELLQNCYEDAEILMDDESEIIGIDFDDEENIAYIRTEE